jgi:hypothetical protein
MRPPAVVISPERPIILIPKNADELSAGTTAGTRPHFWCVRRPLVISPERPITLIPKTRMNSARAQRSAPAGSVGEAAARPHP